MLFESAPGIGKGEPGLASGPPENGSAEKDGHAQRGRLPVWGARLKCLLGKAQEVANRISAGKTADPPHRVQGLVGAQPGGMRKAARPDHHGKQGVRRLGVGGGGTASGGGLGAYFRPCG